MKTLRSISISVKNASLQTREKFSLNEEKMKIMLSALREQFDLDEVLLISTCNRSEIHYFSTLNLNDALCNFFADFVKADKETTIPFFAKIDIHEDAVTYLFEVSAGLHSQVLGDIQISNQVKKAYQWSADMNMAGPFMHRLMHTIFFANKRIVNETSFREGAASVSYAATELVNNFSLSNKNISVLLVGSGEIGSDTARNLYSSGYKNLTICNRTNENAIQLANDISGSGEIKTLNYDALAGNIIAFDIVISSVCVNEPIIGKAHFSNLALHQHKYFIDLGMPRSISPDVEDVPGIVLYNMDDINKTTSESQALRKACIPQVEEIITAATAEFFDWSKEMEVLPVLHKIKNTLETVRLGEIDRFHKQLNENQMQVVDAITKGIIQKIIKLPAVQLKAACKRGDTQNISEVLNELFDIQSKETTDIKTTSFKNN